MLEAEDVTERAGRHEAQNPSRQTVCGIVTAISRGYVEVAIPQGTLLCTVRGKLGRRRPAPSPSRGKPAGRGKNAQPAAPADDQQAPMRAAPGDTVRVLPLGGGEGVVEEIEPRRSVLQRSAGEAGGAQIMLANADHAVLVFAVRDPAPHFGMLDRYLALCEHASIRPTICLNKVDLGVPLDVEAAATLYSGLGYRVLETSAASGEHLAALASALRGRFSLMTGPSGVGKSSLINRMLPDANQRVGEISDATGKGRHTTTGVRLLPLRDGGWLADSAGIRELALWNVPPDALAHCFVELRDVAADCLYEDCTHSADEEGCALRQALADGHITAERFASFERLLDEARAAAPA